MSLFEIFLAIISIISFFAIVSMIGWLLIWSQKHQCEGCKYHVKSSNQCTFNPIYGEPVPDQCLREEWDV